MGIGDKTLGVAQPNLFRCATWLLVSTSPSGEITIPEPSPPRSRPVRTFGPVSTRTTAGPTRSVTPITALE
jgi:hypothetical protein